jgi:anti-sigma factor ChrR (cupin superfamily)
MFVSIWFSRSSAGPKMCMIAVRDRRWIVMAPDTVETHEEPTLGGQALASEAAAETALAALDEVLARIDQRLAAENAAMDKLLASLRREAH